jgi:hypothetical protein
MKQHPGPLQGCNTQADTPRTLAGPPLDHRNQFSLFPAFVPACFHGDLNTYPNGRNLAVESLRPEARRSSELLGSSSAASRLLQRPTRRLCKCPGAVSDTRERLSKTPECHCIFVGHAAVQPPTGQGMAARTLTPCAWLAAEQAHVLAGRLRRRHVARSSSQKQSHTYKTSATEVIQL